MRFNDQRLKAAENLTFGDRLGLEGTGPSAFQDRCLKPLGDPSNKLISQVFYRSI
jgi:hypothetical protein